MPANPAAAFEVVQAEASPRFAAVVFDPLANLALADQVGVAGGGGQAGQPVLDRLGLVVGPLGDQPPFGQGAVVVPSDAVPGRADSQDDELAAHHAFEPSRHVSAPRQSRGVRVRRRARPVDLDLRRNGWPWQEVEPTTIRPARIALTDRRRHPLLTLMRRTPIPNTAEGYNFMRKLRRLAASTSGFRRRRGFEQGLAQQQPA